MIILGIPGKNLFESATAKSIRFLLQALFQRDPPETFWRLLALYLSAGALMLVSWAYYLQPDELDYTVQHLTEVLQWYEGMTRVIPSWYLEKLTLSSAM